MILDDDTSTRPPTRSPAPKPTTPRQSLRRPDMSLSNGGGGILHAPSPTRTFGAGGVGIDPLRGLRRSISRSPSRPGLNRTFSFSSSASENSAAGAQSPDGPAHIARPIGAGAATLKFVSPAGPASGMEINSTTPAGTPTAPPSRPHNNSTPSSHFATPFRTRVKLSLRSSSKSAASRQLPRPPPSPRSPLRRELGVNHDSGNHAPSAAPGNTSWDQENDAAYLFSPLQTKSSDKSQRHSVHLDVSGTSNNTSGGALFEKLPDFRASQVASPLKRNGRATMIPETGSINSPPVAKRRSLHGIPSSDEEVNIFGASLQGSGFEIHDEARRDDGQMDLASAAVVESNEPPFSPLIRGKPSSLRRAALQQKHDKASWGRVHTAQAAQQLASLSGESTGSTSKTRPRLSLDQFVPPPPRDSPFTSQGHLPNPSLHPMEGRREAHPLSRTLTQSSSGSSLPDESPTHFPVHNPKPKIPIFTKSLPYGGPRTRKESTGTSNSQATATPSYKSVKPLAEAFKSTGLVSKVNRNPEQPPQNQYGRLVMPDTPCKKPSAPFGTYPGGSDSFRPKPNRFSMGDATTPLKPIVDQSHGAFVGGAHMPDIFNKRFNHNRRASILSNDGEVCDSFESELPPPTPTKHNLFDKIGTPRNNYSPPAHSKYPAPLSAVGKSDDRHVPKSSCKSNRSEASDHQSDAQNQSSPPDAAAPGSNAQPGGHRQPSSTSSRLLNFGLPSFGRSRARRGSFSTPSPLKTTALISRLSPIKHFSLAKLGRVVPASPLERLSVAGTPSPQTPHGATGMMAAPTEPGRLSILNFGGRGGAGMGERKSSYPPATPTNMSGDNPFYFDRSLNNITPVGPRAEVDESLLGRFREIVKIGSGEFSSVFKVTQLVTPNLSFASPYSTSRGRVSLGSSSPTLQTKVFAVKRVQMSSNARVRNSKLKEVAILRSLIGCSQIVQLVESWESRGFLYIQSEFCEEGSLSEFLAQVGKDGRMDDFRAWKIMLEVAYGVQQIHDAGFIHLDLKPANVFVTFGGQLKIGDFGMATYWPVTDSSDLDEGDRNYMGPEILRGDYGKPADIFSLGMIVLEAAGNVDLPDYGPTWVALREGDLTQVPSLTWSQGSVVLRDEKGNRIKKSESASASETSADDELGSMPVDMDDAGRIPLGLSSPPTTKSAAAAAAAIADAAPALPDFRPYRTGRAELQDPPDFMRRPDDPSSLDRLVRWLLSPEPEDRPSAGQLLAMPGVRWVEDRRRCGATIFEGNWGPANTQQEVLESLSRDRPRDGAGRVVSIAAATSSRVDESDSEMTDV